MKNMKTILSTVLLSSLLLGSTSALAAPGATEGSPAVRKSEGIIGFIESQGPVSPVDPLDPVKPVDPIDPVDPEKPIEPGTDGPLSLDYASSLNFGLQKISTLDETYFAHSQKVKDKEGVITNKPLYAQLTDVRGLEAGWTLSVTQTAQFSTSEGAKLDGAEISFTEGTAVSNSTSAEPSTLMETVEFVPGVKNKVMAAAVNQGAGTWVYRLGDLASIKTVKEAVDAAGTLEDVSKDTAVKLDVPGSATKLKEKQYATELVWTLETTPGND